MWDFFQTVRHRHSIRQYQSDMPVEKAKLHAILETACAAPSAGDLQAYSIIVVTDETTKTRLSQAADNQAFLHQAPVCLVFCAELEISAAQFGERGKALFSVQDATIAAAYAQLATVAAGLGSTWVGQFNEAEIKACLKLNEHEKVVALLSVGYPAEIPRETRRRPLEEVVTYV